MVTVIHEAKPTDRVQVLDVPQAIPGKCVVCGNGADTDRKWIDINVTLDFYGAIYFCTFCLVEIANAVNCATPEQTSKMLDEINDSKEQLKAAQDNVSNLRTAIRSLNLAGYDGNVDTVDEVSGELRKTPDEPVKRDVHPDQLSLDDIDISDSGSKLHFD